MMNRDVHLSTITCAGTLLFGYGLLGPVLDSSTADPWVYRASLTIGGFGAVLSAWAFSKRWNSRSHAINLMLIVTSLISGAWVITEEGSTANSISGWMISVLLAISAFLWFIGNREKRSPIGTTREDGAVLVDYSPRGRAVWKNFDKPTTESRNEEHPPDLLGENYYKGQVS